MIRQKLRSKQGFTLSEMLVTCLILGMMTACVATGVTVAMRVYQQSVATSEASLLASTLTDAVRDELRYARDWDTQNGTYTSATFGKGAIFKLTDEGVLQVGDKPLIDSAAYTGLKAANFSIASNVVNFDICDTGEKVLKPVGFTVNPLNGGSFTTDGATE